MVTSWIPVFIGVIKDNENYKALHELLWPLKKIRKKHCIDLLYKIISNPAILVDIKGFQGPRSFFYLQRMWTNEQQKRDNFKWKDFFFLTRRGSPRKLPDSERTESSSSWEEKTCKSSGWGSINFRTRTKKMNFQLHCLFF